MKPSWVESLQVEIWTHYTLQINVISAYNLREGEGLQIQQTIRLLAILS